MADPFVAEIRLFPFNFVPVGWALCDGRLMSISQNTALFSLLGTFYGGDGRSTFALPDLSGCVPVHQGQGPGLSDYFLGQTGGSETVTLLTSELPVHNHQVAVATQDNADLAFPNAASVLAPSTGGAAYQATATTTLAPQALSVEGSGLPHNNLQPSLVLSYCIALQGVFPPRQ